MRVCVLTLGTRGDVQPYVALGQGLIEHGDTCVICTGESFKSLVESAGIEFARAESDLMAMLETQEGKAILSGGLKNLPLTLRYAKEIVNPAFRKSLDNFWNAAHDADVIIYHPKALAAPDIAQALDIPCVSMPPTPVLYPISEFPNPAFMPTGNLGGFLNRCTYRLNLLAEQGSIREINDFREKTLHVPPRKSGEFTYSVGGKDTPIIYPISQALFPDVYSWEDHVFLPGFFFMDRDTQEPDPAIMDFLRGGAAPIIVSFSSMPLKNPESFKEKLEKALVQSGNRAIILTGSTSLPTEVKENILYIKSAPHTFLFPHAKGIIHHGGVGTMSVALISGVPQVMMPFSVDQPFWAERLCKLGYALEPLHEKSITAEGLISVFGEMETQSVREGAARVKEMIDAESGVDAAIDFIKELV